MEAFSDNFFTLESIIWFLLGLIIGVVLSVWINVKWAYLIRKWFRMFPKVDLYYFDVKTDDFIKDYKSSDNPILRFTVIRDKATSTITIYFTDYLHKPSKTHIHLDTKFDFPFYQKFESEVDYIEKYNANKITYFLDEIFRNATNNWYKPDEVNFTDTLQGVLKVWPQLPNHRAYKPEVLD